MFTDLNLPKFLLSLCTQIKYQKPTPIQQQCIPLLLQRKNLLAASETGTGKTAMFSFPLLTQLSNQLTSIYAIIISPTRELCQQLYEQLVLFNFRLNLRIVLLTGGNDYLKQQNQIEKFPHVIVGTPAAVLNLVFKNSSQRVLKSIKQIGYFVLDEVDRLVLNEGLWNDIEQIMASVKGNSKEVQFVMTSATIESEIQTHNQLFKERILEICPDYETVSVLKNKSIQKKIIQQYILMPENVKLFYFIQIIKKFMGISCIVFVPTCKKCHTLHLILKQLKIDCVCLHSYLTQKERNQNIKVFRNQTINLLIATDVASRGLDIPLVDLIINYNIPRSATDYIHRIGRTARKKGQKGLALSLLTQYDIELLQNIEKHINQQLEEMKINENDIEESMNEVIKAQKLVKIMMHEKGIIETFQKFKEKKLRLKREKNKKMSDQ